MARSVNSVNFGLVQIASSADSRHVKWLFCSSDIKFGVSARRPVQPGVVERRLGVKGSIMNCRSRCGRSEIMIF